MAFTFASFVLTCNSSHSTHAPRLCLLFVLFLSAPREGVLQDLHLENVLSHAREFSTRVSPTYNRTLPLWHESHPQLNLIINPHTLLKHFLVAPSSHAKLKPVSPSASGVNSIKTNSTPAHGGQSDNIDLIISRLQSELTRSQETYADLGFLKHGLGELEKVFVVNTSDKDRHPPTTTQTNGHSTSANGHTSHLKGAPAAVDYERILKEKDVVGRKLYMRFAVLVLASCFN